MTARSPEPSRQDAPATDRAPPSHSVGYAADDDAAALDDRVLACIGHDRVPAAGGDDPRCIRVDLPLLAGPAFEVWRSHEPVQRGWDGRIGFAANTQVLIGQLRLAEDELGAFDRAVFHAYAIIDGFLRRHGYPAWLRVWNYIGHINQGEGDAERYRQFTVGRHKALALKSGFELALPAATAIGTHGGGMLVYFLAGRDGGRPVENPRQVSAFHYPREYGPRSPSFSRGMLLPGAGELLVSGTASIVGHRTLHAGDPRLQLDEALRNIDALCAHAAPAAWRAQVLKLYVRDPADAPPLLERLTQWSGGLPVVALHGDICRRDLAVEIEGLFTAAGATG